MTWTNDIPNSLWHTTNPLPAFIQAQGNAFVLTMGSYIYNGTSLADAQAKYAAQANTQLAPPVTLARQVPSIATPADGQQVIAELENGTYAVGAWSAANSNVTVTAQTIPLASIANWSPVPSL